MKKLIVAGCVVIFSMFYWNVVQAGSITVRDVELKGNNTEILLDSPADKNSVQVDYIRDIVQFSINNATIYPAKMLHADQAAFSKVFAYQYSPNLVRVRFSVESSAEQYKNKVKWSVDGKKVLIQFSAPTAVAAAVSKVDNEKSLLQKIVAASTKDEVKKIVKTAAKSEVISQPLALGGTGKTQIKLAGASSGPSVFRSFLAMFLVVGGLGLILLYVKRRKSGGMQAKKTNHSWFSNFLPQNRKQKPIMEVIATHMLGAKQSIVVMKIRGQQFVLAVTPENIQLITQIDADESELDLLDDPKVAASIGKMFGVEKLTKSPSVVKVPSPDIASEINFNSLLKNSTGAGAIIGRKAYASNSISEIKPGLAVGGARDLIRKRLEGKQ